MGLGWIGMGRKFAFNVLFDWKAFWASLISATIEDADPDAIILTFPSAQPTLTDMDFTVTVNGGAVAVSSASWTGAVITLVLASNVVVGDAVIVTFVPTGGTTNVTNNVGQAEVKTYITGLTTPLSQAQRSHLNTLVTSLKTGLSISNLSDFFDIFYVLGGETEESSLRNLVSNNYHCTNVHATAFAQYEGFTGDGSNDYLTTGYKPHSNGANATLNDISIGVYSRTNNQTGYDFGAKAGAADDMLALQLRNGSDRIYWFVNQDSATDYTSKLLDSTGLWIATRAANNNKTLFRNDANVAGKTTISTTMPDVTIAICGTNTNGTITYGTKQLALAFVGKLVTTTIRDVIFTAFETYMTANGKGLFFLMPEGTMKAYETDKHYGFSTTFFIGSRMFCFYRDGRSHQSYDGEAMMIYSDDDGENWSEAVSVYTGEELITEAVLLEDPLAAADVRDLKVTVLDNGTVVLLGFVAIGHNLTADDTDPADPENIDVRVALSSKSFCITIPYTDTTFDFESKTISYIADLAFGGACAYKNSILYATVYGGGAFLYKSIDYGATWSLVSTIFSSELALNGNETTLCFVDDVLYAIGRGYDPNDLDGVLARSNDNGVTWADYTELDERLDGLDSVLLPDNKILVFGRGLSRYMAYYTLNGLVASESTILLSCVTNDIGYGSVFKEGDYYYFIYGDGPLRAYPNLYDHAYSGIYFQKISEEEIE